MDATKKGERTHLNRLRILFIHMLAITPLTTSAHNLLLNRTLSLLDIRAPRLRADQAESP